MHMLPIEPISACPCISNGDRVSLPKSSGPPFTFQFNDILAPAEELGDCMAILPQVCRDLAKLDPLTQGSKDGEQDDQWHEHGEARCRRGMPVDGSLASLKSTQTRLLWKLESLQAFSETYVGRLSPIQLIPTEILIEIFSYLKPGVRDLNTTPAQGGSLLPTHVCQQWRQVALSTPTLWNHISACVDASQRNTRLMLECVEAWLTRTRDCPLSINIRCQLTGSPDIWNALLDLLLPQSHRWRHAAIASLHKTDLSRVRNNLPLLETLDLSLLYPEHVSTDSFENTPMLKTVFVDVRNGYRKSGGLPWSQLTYFKAAGCTVAQAFSLLQNMHNVVTFVAHLYNGESDSKTPTFHPLRLFKLQTLELSYASGVESLFDCLYLPSLTHFSFWESNSGSTVDWGVQLVSLIQRSSCHLKSLQFTLQSARGQASVDDVIRVSPKLEHLYLAPLEYGTTWGYGSVIRSLTASSAGGARLNPVPELHNLGLVYARGFQPQDFVEMVESRWRLGREMSEGPVARIRSVRLGWVPHAAVFDPAALARLSEFAEEGLDIAVHIKEGGSIDFQRGLI
ncbi:hypothetical protein FIBSPDRAFT_245318 [Athelia psychrophila]|uniref:F-box domain-containing protein n=1 Tax=Athelia psychrophila TaxID=1759441 RepID=A0A166RT77_9AGAM|nr:hypothetical protein FIBSPDRAFT_245318 [Fibularhizoctonia sp. CBS 109695]